MKVEGYKLGDRQLHIMNGCELAGTTSNDRILEEQVLSSKESLSNQGVVGKAAEAQSEDSLKDEKSNPSGDSLEVKSITIDKVSFFLFSLLNLYSLVPS